MTFRSVPPITMVFVLAFAVAVAAQNPPAKTPASRTSASAVDNEQIRVTKVVQQPHVKTRPHQHNMNRVMVYLTSGTQVNDYQGRKEVLNFKPGEALWSAAGGIHVAEVTSETPITIVEMELRKRSGKNPATPLDPVTLDPRHYKVEFENDQVRVLRVRIGPHESTPVHEHVLNRVVTYVTDQNFRITGADGKQDTQLHQAGDIVWGEGAKHKEENLSDKPFEAVIVELK
jgi:quercetin dioxygenase-like cupin family protein